MSDLLTLSAEPRERAGKGASRALRREGRVPAVIYGNNQDAENIHVEEKALIKALMTGHFSNSIVEVTVNGKRIEGPGPDRGMVFQKYTSFAWLTVAQNIGYGLELKGVAEGDMVVTSGQIKLRNGVPLIVDNRVVPTNDPAPKIVDK